MNNTDMPAAEVQSDASEQELMSYELAFHVLPTVAEGEVSGVVDALKQHISHHDGTCTVEEAPARIELAYEIEKPIEGRNRKFTSAYFGWIRFTMAPGEVPALTAEIEAQKELLRYLLVRLSKAEEAHPFYYHEALADETAGQVTDIDTDALAEEAAETTDEPAADAEDTASADGETAADEAEDGSKA